MLDGGFVQVGAELQGKTVRPEEGLGTCPCRVAGATCPIRPSPPRTCSSSVDLPTPGSPPTSTSDPMTTPPPSTLQAQGMEVEQG